MNNSFSGCDFIIDKEAKTIFKFSVSQEYKPRLLMQAQKQIIFNKFNNNKNIIIPDVLSIKTDGFVMEYIPELIDHISLFENAKIVYIKKYIDNVFNFVNTNLSKSYYINGTELERYRSMVLTKLESINSYGLISTEETSKLNDFIKSIDEPLLLGPCHGDLTLNNVLSNGSDVVIIDFLDSFIDSPIVDIVKIRQDTQGLWSIMLKEKIGNPLGYKKTISVYGYINKKLENIDIKCNRWFLVFDILNYMRILPYAIQRKENIEYLIKIIKTKIGEL